MRISTVAIFAALVWTGPAFALDAGDVTHGKTLYSKCRSCHTAGADGIGPRHCDVVGRKAGSIAGYNYSPAMQKCGLTWTPENLDRFLAEPAKTVPGTFMTFAGIHKPQDRADLIAYLATLKCP